MVELLLKNEADVDARNVCGTALHAAAENGHTEVVRLLLEERADINTEDEEGKTALDRAADRRREVMAKLGQEALTPKNSRQWCGCFAKHVATWKKGEDQVGIQNKVQSRFIQKKGLLDPY